MTVILQPLVSAKSARSKALIGLVVIMVIVSYIAWFGVF